MSDDNDSIVKKKAILKVKHVPKPVPVLKRRIMMKAELKTPEATDMLSQLQGIYAAQIAAFSSAAKSADGLSSRQINDLSKLVSSLAVINREIRESQEQGLLEGLSFQEQLSILQQALDSLGVIDGEYEEEE